MISRDDFVQKLKENFSDFQINFDAEDAILIKEQTPGRRVKNVKLGNHELARY